MVRRKSSKAEPPTPKEWTLAEIVRGIEKLRRRIADVQALASNQVSHDDARVSAVESDIVQTIEEVFGAGSRENREHSYVDIHKGPYVMAGFQESEAAINARAQRAFLAGIPDMVTMLEGLIRRLEEKKEELFPSSGSSSVAYSEPVTVRSIEQRLAMLAELKSKGIISAEEYASRRGKILDEV